MLTRFAPAPTGFLHLGHVVNAIFVWGVARLRGARVLLRIEDHDRQRCRPAFEAALLDDLEWLGFVPDLGRFEELRAGRSAFRQSDNADRYARALHALGRTHHVYACECSRKDIEAALGRSGTAWDLELRYPGTCRDKGLDWKPGLGLRVVLEPGMESFRDLASGEQHQDPSRQCGDLLLRDRLGNWTYQFAVVVDDLEQNVELVIRGRDLLESTGRQIRLGRLLGRETPAAFFHHPLIVKPSGEKLSKSSRDTGVRELRAAGLSAEAVIGRAAWLLRVLERPQPVSAREASGLVTAWAGGAPAR